MDFSGFKDIVKDLTQSADQRAVSRALKFYSKGELDRAVATLEEAKEKSPESTAIHFDLARYLILAHRGHDAAEALRIVLRREPRSYPRVNEMIEELRASRAHVGPLYDAIAEHFIRQEQLPQALEALERMSPEELRTFLPRHKAKWESVRRSAPDAKMAKPSLQSAYYLALACEVLRDYEQAGGMYRTVAANNAEELPRVLKRLEALLAKDYHNAALRVAVGELFLAAGRVDDGVQQLSLAIETEPRAVSRVRGRIEAFLQEKGEHPAVRWLLVTALVAARETEPALAAIRPLVEAGERLDDCVPLLERLAAADQSGRARALLATASLRRGHAQAALETLLHVAEEKGLPAIRGELEAIAAAAPGFARPWHLLTDVHMAEGSAAAAVECMRKAMTLAPGEESLLAPKLGKLLEADPRSPDAHLLLADLQARAGGKERAIVLLRHLIRVAPPSAAPALERFAPLLKDEPAAFRARVGAAEACLELRRHLEALQHLTAAAEASPEGTAEFLHAFGVLAEAAPDLHARIVEALRALLPKTPLPQAVQFAIGEAAFAGGDLVAAAAAFREALQGAPDRAEEVRQALERFDRDNPAAAEARYLLASLYLERRDHTAALRELRRTGSTNAGLLKQLLARYEEMVAGAPDDLEARVAFVEVLMLAGQADRVLELGPGLLKVRDDATTARVSLALGDALAHRQDADAAVKRYFAAYGRDRALSQEVVKRLKDLVTAEGTHALASLALGKVLAGEGRIGEATESLRAACGADPKLQETVTTELQKLMAAAPADPQPGLAMLSLLLAAHDVKRAIQTIARLLDAHTDLASVLAPHLEQILKASPKEPFATYELGRALQHLKLLPRAAALYLAAFRLDEGLAPLILRRLQECNDAAPAIVDPYLAACAIHAARGKFQAAAEKIQQALLKAPGESERLLPRLEEICRQHPGNPQMQMVLAQSSLRAGRYDRALPAFAEAARRDPTLLDAAFEGYEVIVKAAPGNSRAYLERARVHAQRMRAELALSDLDRACRLDPSLVPEVLEEVQAIRERFPEGVAGVVLLADLLAATGRDADAVRLLREEKERGWAGVDRLAILVRLWRFASARQEDEEARACLEEASRLAPDPNQFLQRVHESLLTSLRGTAARVPGDGDGTARRSDLELVLRALIDLGELGRAASLLEKHGDLLDRSQAARLRGETFLRRGEYPRALEHLKELGASRALAFGAARAGDHALAARTLETLLQAEGDRPDLRRALERAYRELVVADLEGSRVRLMGETRLDFTEGTAA
ncbi:MAG: tetratricopeptide repeat protein [Candidatus Polarisedimenticolia bacterium]